MNLLAPNEFIIAPSVVRRHTSSGFNRQDLLLLSQFVLSFYISLKIVPKTWMNGDIPLAVWVDFILFGIFKLICDCLQRLLF